MSYGFPNLDKKTIVDFLVGVGYTHIGEQDLMKPTRDVMVPLYEFLMHHLMGVSRDDLNQPVFSALEYLEDAELHEESVGNLAFTRHITRIMQVCRVPDFSMNDVFKPDGKSTIRNLSAIMNFAKHKEQKDTVLADLLNERERRLELRDHVALKLQRVKAEIQAKDKAALAEEPAKLALQKDIKQMQQQILGYKKRYAALCEEQRGHKEEYSKIADQVSQEKFSITEAKERGAELKKKIVQSPEKLQRLLEEQQEKLDKARQSADEKKLSVQVIEKKIEAYTKAEKKVRKCVATLQDYEKQIADQKQVSKELKALKAKVTDCEKEKRAYETRVTQSRLEGQHLMEQADKLERQAALRLQEIQNDLQVYTAQHSSVLANLRETSAQLKRLAEAQKEDLARSLSENEVRKNALLAGGASKITGLVEKVRLCG